MTFEVGLRTKLLAAATGIATLVSPVLGKPGANKSVDRAPLQIVYSLEGREDIEWISEPEDLLFGVFEINCIGSQDTYDEIVALANAVEVAINGIHTGYGDVVVRHAQLLQVFDRVIDAEASLVARALQFKFGYQRS